MHARVCMAQDEGRTDDPDLLYIAHTTGGGLVVSYINAQNAKGLTQFHELCEETFFRGEIQSQ